jgi:HD-GYP domain-containing protein (c-di-GMP phosphodiesterase class II)
LEGFYYNKSESNNTEDAYKKGISLIAKHGEIEIMMQPLFVGAAVWLLPAGDHNTMEFFFVHSGELEVTLDGKIVTFTAGDSFYLKGLGQEVFMKTKANSMLLYISSKAVYETSTDFHSELTKMIVQINDKDNYTFRHSRNVMRYSIKLYDKLKAYCTDETVSNIAVSALFHDIGKCFIPDEILKKKGKLDLAEYKKVMRHPIDTARLLKPHFNDKVVELAQGHHERLDGSGYPFGLMQEDLSIEARILAVADVFDAMTTDRGYNDVKTFKEAVEELMSLPDKFDKRVTTALSWLVEEEAFGPEDDQYLNIMNNQLYTSEAERKPNILDY